MNGIDRPSRPNVDRPGGKYVEYKGGTVPITNTPPIDVQSVDPVSANAVDPVSANAVDPEPYEIVIKPKHLENKYIDDKLRAKGLDVQQIREARSRVREYIDLLLKGKNVDMTDDAYEVLVNMAIHLIEESSKIE